jgi:hypothetical protein
VLGAFSEEFVGAGIVDIDVVVVRTNCQLGAIWRVLDGFDPLLGVSV